MTINFRKYVATVSRFVEHENGSITKETFDITLKGQRFSEASVWKQIPRDCKLVSHGYKSASYEVDADKLESWLIENGKPVEKEADNK